MLRRSHSPHIVCCALTLALAGCGGGGEDAGPSAPPAPPGSPAPPVGLDARPVNATCHAWERSATNASISLRRFTTLSFDAPVAMMQAPGDDRRWYVVEQGGAVRTFADAQATTAQTFIDITARVVSGGEMGLLGMAFAPQFPTDPRVFLSYTAPGPLRSIIAEYRLTAGDPLRLDAGSERVLLTVPQPETNHNGGQIAFGPDGYLYIGLGDGGSGGDPHGAIGNGQSLQTLLGKILRIDVSDTSGAVRYRIPPTNPYASGAVCNAGGTIQPQCAEIYAYGFRNPWRWSFDRQTGELWVGDVGQGAWEEIDRVTAGGNYGWRCREGAHDYNPSGCDMTGLIDPVAEYDRTQGQSVTGGYVYRGVQSTPLAGRYLFADFVSGRIWAWIAENAQVARQPTLLLNSGASISSFGEGADGELYVVDYGGALHQIVFGAEAGPAPPQTLSATGCVAPADAAQPASGLIPYSVNAPFWSDGADKQRWLALPAGQSIAVAATGDFDLPIGSVVMKHFRDGARLLETRLLMRHPDGGWGGYAYRWNEQQTDAALALDGAVLDLGGGRNWIVPSSAQCRECHTSAAGDSLGLELAQLNGQFTYPTGRNANQLLTLSHIGVLAPPVNDPASVAALPDPYVVSADLTARARAYLHTNCAQCHRPGGPTPSTMDLRHTTALNATNTCNATPQSGDLGLGVNARIIAPGAAADSVLVNRMNRRDQHAMPPLASTQVDAAGVALITQWIDALSAC